MEIYIGRSEHSSRLNEKQKTLTRNGVKRLKERRKAARDRRLSVNEGLLVCLSTKNERRSPRERRKVAGHF